MNRQKNDENFKNDNCKMLITISRHSSLKQQRTLTNNYTILPTLLILIKTKHDFDLVVETSVTFSTKMGLNLNEILNN